MRVGKKFSLDVRISIFKSNSVSTEHGSQRWEIQNSSLSDISAVIIKKFRSIVFVSLLWRWCYDNFWLHLFLHHIFFYYYRLDLDFFLLGFVYLLSRILWLFCFIIFLFNIFIVVRTNIFSSAEYFISNVLLDRIKFFNLMIFN